MFRNRWPQALSIFAVGLGAGAALAVLFAPCSGAETRGYLREAAEDGIDESIHRGKKVARRVRKHLMGDAAAIASEVADSAASALSDARNAALH
jgi:gas vesicle protein